MSNSYDGVFGATPVTIDIGQLRTILASYRTTVRDYSFTLGKTQTIVDLGKLLKNFAVKAANVLIDYVEALENIVSTGNVPNRKVFEHFEEPYLKLQKFFAKDAVKFVHELEVLIGCPPSREFKSILKSLEHQVEFIAQSVHRIVEAVESGKNKREFVQRQATIISNRVVKLSKIIESQLAVSVVQLAERIEGANMLVEEMLLENTTRQIVGSIVKTTRSYINQMRKSALDVYISGEQGIRTELSSSIGLLSVYRKFKVVGYLSHQIEESYNNLYNYLQNQNRTNINLIKQSYNMTAVNTNTLINETAEAFLDEAKHTVLEFINFFLDGRLSDQCVADYQNLILSSYDEFTSNITECFDQEKSFWNEAIQAFTSSVDLLQTSTNRVAASIAHCAGFAICKTKPIPKPLNTKSLAVSKSLFCAGSTDLVQDSLVYARTKACLKTVRYLLNTLSTLSLTDSQPPEST